jgi:NADH-quinone oxidoreductase subunit N
MIIALLSMAGIPPLAGFFAKYFILLNVIEKGYILIAVIAILASLIGVYYYFKLIIAMFSGTSEDTSVIEVPQFTKLILILISVILIVVGVLPDFILGLIFR